MVCLELEGRCQACVSRVILQNSAQFRRVELWTKVICLRVRRTLPRWMEKNGEQIIFMWGRESCPGLKNVWEVWHFPWKGELSPVFFFLTHIAGAAAPAVPPPPPPLPCLITGTHFRDFCFSDVENMLNLSSEMKKVYKVSYPVFRTSNTDRPVAAPGRNKKRAQETRKETWDSKR